MLLQAICITLYCLFLYTNLKISFSHHCCLLGNNWFFLIRFCLDSNDSSICTQRWYFFLLTKLHCLSFPLGIMNKDQEGLECSKTTTTKKWNNLTSLFFYFFSDANFMTINSQHLSKAFIIYYDVLGRAYYVLYSLFLVSITSI